MDVSAADAPTNCLHVNDETYCVGEVYGRHYQGVQLYRLDGERVAPIATFHTPAAAEAFRMWFVGIATVAA